jgi:hypothetical protein
MSTQQFKYRDPIVFNARDKHTGMRVCVRVHKPRHQSRVMPPNHCNCSSMSDSLTCMFTSSCLVQQHGFLTASLPTPLFYRNASSLLSVADKHTEPCNHSPHALLYASPAAPHR